MSEDEEQIRPISVGATMRWVRFWAVVALGLVGGLVSVVHWVFHGLIPDFAVLAGLLVVVLWVLKRRQKRRTPPPYDAEAENEKLRRHGLG